MQRVVVEVNGYRMLGRWRLGHSRRGLARLEPRGRGVVRTAY